MHDRSEAESAENENEEATDPDDGQSCDNSSGYGYDHFKEDEFYKNMPNVKWLLYPDDEYQEASDDVSV